MKINSIKYFTTDALKSLKRNLTISIASMVTVAVTLFIFGLFLLLMLNVNKMMSNVESSVEIKVYLKDDITEDAKTALQDTLSNNTNVSNVYYESKEEALSNFSETLSDKDKELLSGYGQDHNPLPASYIVKFKTPESSEGVINSVKDMEGVYSIGNDRDLVNNIISISKALRWLGVALFVLLIGVSLFLIVNTIRLTVFSRRREIGIMKFVGATDWFIRWPFIIEGLIIGVVGAIIGNLTLFWVYGLAYSKVTTSLVALKLIEPVFVTNSMLWQFGIAGALIGSIGSFIALRKFLIV